MVRLFCNLMELVEWNYLAMVKGYTRLMGM